MRQSRFVSAVPLRVLLLAVITLACTGAASPAAVFLATTSQAAVPPAAAAHAEGAASSDNPFAIRYLSSKTFAIAGLAPGDHSQWAAEVTNTGARSAQMSVSTAAADSGLLAKAVRAGLQIRFSACPGELESTVSTEGVHSFTCPETMSQLAQTRVGNLRQAVVVVPAGRTVGLRAIISLPREAGNELQNQDANLELTFALGASGSAADEPIAPRSVQFAPALGGADLGAAAAVGIIIFCFGAALMSSQWIRRSNARAKSAELGIGMRR